MKLWGKLLLFYIVIMLLIGYAFQIAYKHLTIDALEQRTATQQTAYSRVLHSNRILSDTFFNEVLNREEILSLVQEIVNSEGDKQQIQRGLLHRALFAAYQRNKKEIAEILHFHFPDNRSMLRFHRPQKADDDLTDLRPSVVLANNSLRAVYGYENGRFVHAYRHVYPLVYQGEHIGSVEVSPYFNAIYDKVQKLETASQTQFIFFLKKKEIVENLLRKQDQYYIYEELHQGFVRQKRSPNFSFDRDQKDDVPDEVLNLLENLKNDNQIQANMQLDQDFSRLINVDRLFYSIVFHAVKNASDQDSGYLLGITPEPQLRKLVNQFWVYYCLTGAILLGILVYRGILQVALQEKKKNQESLQAFFDNKLVGMVYLNAEGFYQQVNHHWEDMTGYSRDELLTMSFHDLTHPEDLTQESLFYQLSKSGDQQTLQLIKRYVRKNGSVFWGNISATGLYDDRNQLIGLVGMIIDITGRKQAEEERERLLQAIDQSSETIVITDADGTIQYANPAFARITGYTCEEAIGQNPRILKSNRHDNAFYEEMWNTLLLGETWNGQIINKKKDDTFYTEEVTISPVCDASGRIVNYVAVKRDISNEIRAEEQRLELEAQLRQKYKMEAVGVMAGGMAHNFNNNLAIILGNIELCQLKLPADNVVIDYLKNVKTAVFRSRDLVQKILTYSRQGEHDKSPVNLQLIIDETIKLIGSTIPSTVNLQQTMSTGRREVTINADFSQIQEALVNLCNNAVHAMNEGGDLALSLEIVELSQEDIPARYERSPGWYAKLSVQDTGSGMSAETQDKIFDLFFTTKDVDEGTGVGLSTVQGIVDQHDGLLMVNSTLGQGSTFELYFPLIADQQYEPPPAVQDLPGGHERILFLDDDEMIANIWSRMLSEHGYQVTTETSSIEALATFKKNPEKFDLVITDQTMPKLSGKDLIKELLSIRPDFPNILCTGYSSRINEDEARELGIKAFCLKPLDLSEFLQTVRAVLDGE